MKARIKATGEIVEVEDCGSVFRYGAFFHGYKDANGIKYLPDEIELQMDFDYFEACQDETLEYAPDYWTRLEHTYAGMALQGLILTASKHMGTDQEVAQWAKEYAHALVEKIKEERK